MKVIEKSLHDVDSEYNKLLRGEKSDRGDENDLVGENSDRGGDDDLVGENSDRGSDNNSNGGYSDPEEEDFFVYKAFAIFFSVMGSQFDPTIMGSVVDFAFEPRV